MNKLNEAQKVQLSKVLPSDHFRTIDNFDMYQADSEVPVEIKTDDSYIRWLTFNVSEDGIIFAYARNSSCLSEFLEKNGLEFKGIEKICFEPETFKFKMKIITKEASPLFDVSFEDVTDLLNNCCRVLSQR